MTTIARVLPRTTAALDPGAIVASTAEATLRSLWAAPETKTAARGLVLAGCAVAAGRVRPTSHEQLHCACVRGL